MKIFKQIQIFIIFLFFVNLPLVSANWYWDHTERPDNVSNIQTQGVKTTWDITFCDEDGELDGHWIKWNYLPSWVPDYIKRTSRAPSYDGVNTPMRWDWMAPNTWDNPIWQGYYITQSRATEKRTGWGGTRMTCQMWDGTDPWLVNINYHDGWTNDRNIKITLEAKDYGGAWIDNLEIQEITSTNWPNFEDLNYKTDWRTINPTVNKNWNWNTFSATINYNVNPTPWKAYKFRFRVRDKSGNVSKNADWTEWMEWKNVYKLDTVEPSLDDIETGDEGGARIFAGCSDTTIAQYFFPGKGAPMKTFKYEVTNPEIGRPKIVKSKNWPKYKWFFKWLEDKWEADYILIDEVFNNIDWALDVRTNSRIIKYKTLSITDEAGNEFTFNKEYTFNVVSNSDKITRNELTDNLFSWVHNADGLSNIYTHSLKDECWNSILPVTIWWKKIREITRKVQTKENKMYLNQQTRTWSTSVFVNNQSLSFGNWILLFSNTVANSNNDYNLDLKVYTPTANSYSSNEIVSDPDARFSLSTWFEIKNNKDILRFIQENVTTSKKDIDNPIYKPLFTSEFSWDIKDWWFIEGTLQNNSIKIIKNSNSTINPSNQKFILIYSGSQTPVFDLHYDRSNSEKGLPASKFILSEKTWFENNFSSPKNFRSFLKQKSDIVGDVSKLQLSSHFSYTLDWKNIFYNSAIIGKSHYHDTNEENNTTQAGVKIIGLANDKYLKHLLQWQQDDSDSIIINSLLAKDVYNSITKSIALSVRNIVLNDSSKNISNLDNVSVSDSSGVKAGMVETSRWKIFYIEANWQNIELGDSFSNFEISGIRTLVVRGGNVYIKSNMYYANNNSILWVVVQKDNSWQWWNIYIDPSVTNIVGSYIADGSVISYDNNGEISIWQIHKLKNQLHIFGSILSHNTIGWARANPVICPITENSCWDVSVAQKYDLNYLRRYYIYQWKPFWGGKVIGGGTVNSSGDIDWPNTGADLIRKFRYINEGLAKHPVIIEYNPNVINNPPLGFDIYQE